MSALAEITGLLKQTAGIDPSTMGPTALEFAVCSRVRASACGNVDEYWQRLRYSPSELQALIEAVVVPETWFFRDPAAFSAFTQIVTREWLPANPARKLQILSLPCATGEEPYSIAMALLDAGVSPERFGVVGVDISERSITVAKRALYGRNSFRSANLSFQARHFRRRDQKYEVAPSVLECVRFQTGNLFAADLFPPQSFDVIFCRNVLIYFDRAAQTQGIANLDRLLAPEGVLFLGPAEALLPRSHFDPIAYPHAFACRKAKPSAPAKAQVAPRRVKNADAVLRPRLAKPSIKTPRATSRVPSPPPPAQVKHDAVSGLELAQSLANAGRLEEAARVCETYIREIGACAPGYYLLALVCDGLRLEQSAADCYRKVLYLDPNHADALMHLALQAQRDGDLASANRLRTRAQRAHPAGKHD